MIRTSGKEYAGAEAVWIARCYIQLFSETGPTSEKIWKISQGLMEAGPFDE